MYSGVPTSEQVNSPRFNLLAYPKSVTLKYNISMGILYGCAYIRATKI